LKQKSLEKNGRKDKNQGTYKVSLQQKFSLLEMKTYLRLPSPWNALRIEKENQVGDSSVGMI